MIREEEWMKIRGVRPCRVGKSGSRSQTSAEQSPFRRDAKTNAPIRLATLAQGRLTICLRSKKIWARSPDCTRGPSVG